MEKTTNRDLGIELSFLDKRENSFKITARLFADKERSSVFYTLNGEKKEAVLCQYAKTNDTLCYIFEILLDNSLLKSRQALSFDEDVRTGPFFPIEFKCNGYFLKGDVIVYNEGSTLVTEPYSKELLKARKKKYKVLALNKTALVAYAIRMLNKALRVFQKKELWLISDRIDKAGDNGQVFFEYVTRNTPKNVKPVFVLDKKSPDYKEIKKIGKVVSPLSPFYKIRYTLASMHISSQLDGSRLLKVRAYLKDILNDSKVIFLQHGVIEHDSSSYYNRFDFGMDMFVTTTRGEYDSIVGIKAYGCDRDIVELCGLCRYDKLENKRKNIIFVCPTWRLSLLEDTESLRLKDGFEESAYYNFYQSLLRNENLLKKVRDKGYKICFYPHRMMKNAKKHFDLSSDCIIDGEGISYTEMFKSGAILVTDYSSVQFDFTYLKKPVIYCQFDKEEFFSSHTCQEGYMEYERDGLGPVCYDLDSAVNTLCEYIDNGAELEEKYRERIDNTFKFTDRQNCERTLKRILEIRNDEF